MLPAVPRAARSAKLHQAGKQLWQEALSKFPGDDVAARVWFDEHIIHRIEQLPVNEEAAQEDAAQEDAAQEDAAQEDAAQEDALVERVRTICLDAAQMYPDRGGDGMGSRQMGAGSRQSRQQGRPRGTGHDAQVPGPRLFR
jgi:hypothetical protein